MAGRTAQHVEQVADGVHFVGGPMVNWVLVADGDDLTLIDAGYPRQTDEVARSIRAIGRHPADVRAILLTHAHLDHMGGAPAFVSRYGTPVLTGAREAAHARREFLEQLGPGELAANLSRPGVPGWAGRMLRLVGPHLTMAVPTAAPFAGAPAGGGALDLPGGPVPIASPGHTTGHTGYLLPRHGVLVSGDALATGHPTSPRSGPQLLPDMFHHDVAAAGRALDAFRGLDAGILLPGHGPAAHAPIADLVDAARRP